MPGYSLWDWHKLPDYIAPRYTDYARANASIGINGAVLTNVNAKALILTPPVSGQGGGAGGRVSPLRHSQSICLPASRAPMEIGGLTTADPLDPDVIAWWQAKVDEIYDLIPDFGGFVVKANSEGQPGPHDYGRIAGRRREYAGGRARAAQGRDRHAGAPSSTTTMTRKTATSRPTTNWCRSTARSRRMCCCRSRTARLISSRASRFIRCSARCRKTPLMLEVQITQEYLGCATHLAYLAPLFKETLDADTGCQGAGSTVARVVDGSLDGHALSAWLASPTSATIATGAGILSPPPTGTPSGGWRGITRSAPKTIADEWLRMTFSNDARFVEACQSDDDANRARRWSIT